MGVKESYNSHVQVKGIVLGIIILSLSVHQRSFEMQFVDNLVFPQEEKQVSQTLSAMRPRPVGAARKVDFVKAHKSTSFILGLLVAI